jgi:outer membrane biosynthesis protein TonB
MFDNVGKNTNRSARRQLAALLLALLSVATTLSVLIWAASRVVEVIEKKDDVLEVPVSLAAPPPPPPPPGGGSHKPKTEKKKPDPVKPVEEVPQEVKPLDDKPPDPTPAADDKPDGPAGVEGGVAGGVEGGKVGGTVGGTGDTLGAPVVKSVHYSEVKPKVMPKAEFPAAAVSLGMKDEFCQVRVEIGLDGKPETAEAVDGHCPSVFKDAAEAGAMHSEFYPYVADGQPMKVKFIWNFHFISNH